MRYLQLALLVFGGLALTGPADAQLVINEFSSSSTSDWIELYNTATQSADLTGYLLKDSASNKTELSGSLPTNAYLVVDFSNWLNNTGDTINLLKLVDGQEQLLDDFGYGSAGFACLPTAEGSLGRQPDGGATWVRFGQAPKIAQTPKP